MQDDRKEQIKKELEALGERLGERVGRGLGKDKGSQAGGSIGKKVGRTVGEQAERIHGAIERETVTKDEELGIGGKVGTGLGILGKHLMEKRGGELGTLANADELISSGRTIGAKTEKALKRTVMTGLRRIFQKNKDKD